MAKANFRLIRSLSITLLGCMLVSSSLYGQSESALKEFFEGKTVVVRTAMPASHEGIDVYPKRAESIGLKKSNRELSQHGTALSWGQEVRITLIKTKSKHIEVHLGGGGYKGSAPPPPVEKSRREIELERKIPKETDSKDKSYMEDELEKLKRERTRRDEENKIASEKSKRKVGGSRFNIRYESKLTEGDMTPESVMAALSEYLDFPAVAPPQAPRKFYPIDESHLDPSFAEFKTRLLEAVERRDLDFLLSIVHPKIYLGQERSSPEHLKQNWGGEMNWQDLRDMLSLGAVRSSFGFCAPYIPRKFPDELNFFESVVITGSDVPIRAEPNSTAAVIDRLSYDIVSRLSRGASWDTIEGEKYQWWHIETPAGEVGYVWGKYARSPMGFEVCFDKTDGQWMMTSWSGGD